MIDKNKGGDYEGLRPRGRRLRLIAGALLWAWVFLAAGSQPCESQVRLGNPDRGGESLDIRSILPRDRTTVVNFFSPYCHPCLQLAPILAKLAGRMPEVAFVKLNINRPRMRGIDWRSPLARQYRLKSVPYFMIFNPKGSLVAEGPEAQKMLQKWLQKTGLAP